MPSADDNVAPDLDPNCLTLIVFLIFCSSKKLILKKKSANDKKHEKFPREEKLKLQRLSLEV